MEWVVKLEARSGWGEVETIEVATIKRRVVGLTAEEVGLTLAEGKDLLGEFGRLVLQTQMEEYTFKLLVGPVESGPSGAPTGHWRIVPEQSDYVVNRFPCRI